MRNDFYGDGGVQFLGIAVEGPVGRGEYQMRISAIRLCPEWARARLKN
jgi:hypothetical protein